MAYCLEGDFVKYSGNYGIIDIKSKPFDDSQDLGGTEAALLHHRIKSIKIYTGKIKEHIVIGGIQITYKNIITNEVKELPIRKGNIQYEEEDINVFELESGEYLNKFHIRFENDENYLYQLGFETNKKRQFLKGCEYGEEKNSDLNKKDIIILGTFGHYNTKLDSIGILFVDALEYNKKNNKGYFELKFRIKKDKKYRKKIEKKYKDLSESDKYLFKTCLLSEHCFNEIIKFVIL